MLQTRLLLLLSAASIIAVLFFLPKVVVDDENVTMDKDGETKITEKKGPNTMGLDPSHTQKLAPEDRSIINKLKEKLKSSANIEKSAIFADSLASAFQSVNKLDSAAKYAGLVASYKDTEENWQKAGNAYYEAFKFSMSPEKATLLGVKVRNFYEKVLLRSPDKVDLKARIAVTLTASQNPMKGILMLRDVLNENPDNREALYNLGLMSMKTGQYRKAIQRFGRLAVLDENDYEPYFYLGMSYKELGEKDSAIQSLGRARERLGESEVELIRTIDDYLKEIR